MRLSCNSWWRLLIIYCHDKLSSVIASISSLLSDIYQLWKIVLYLQYLFISFFKRCNSFGCNFRNNIRTKSRKWKLSSLSVFSFMLCNKIGCPTLFSLFEKWHRSKPFFCLCWACLMLLVADSWISPLIRAANARITSNVSSS